MHGRLLGFGSVLAGGTAQAAVTPITPVAKKQCHAAWKMAGPMGDTLSKDKAEPFVVNFAWSLPITMGRLH
jgi:hypothetical protein